VEASPSGVQEAATADKDPNDAAPADVLELARQAQAKTAAGEHKEAAVLLERIVALNPVQPNFWYALGTAHYNAKDYAAAIPAYEKAAELGAPIMGAYYSLYNVACCQALLGEKEAALATLERAMDLGFPDLGQPAADEDLVSLRGDPRFIEMLGLKDVSKMTRDDGWRYDLSILTREVRRKGFNPHLYVNRPVTREQFDARSRELHEAIPKLTDGQIILEMMKLMAFLQDGHTAVWDLGEHPLYKAALPLRMFLFEEGLFVTAADPAQQELLGAQVMAFDGRPVAEVLDALRPYINRDRGNPMKDKVSLPYAVRMLGVLHAAGLIRSPDRVTLTVRDIAGAEREVTVEADTKEPDIWNKLPAPEGWVTLSTQLDNPPLYVQNMQEEQWFEYLPEEKTIYFGFNGVSNGKTETFAQFTQRLVAFIDENDVEKLVIDMRWNNGGNTALGQPLLQALIATEKVNQRGRLFVIIGRRTYSAAQNMATYFERYTNATFVGEPTGSSPNFVGEEVPVTLPYSKVMANVSHLFWQSSWPQDQRIWIAPHIYVAPTFADFRAGRDPSLEAILALPVP
jgi:tetratricopeptide (TPR) repeat protein